MRDAKLLLLNIGKPLATMLVCPNVAMRSFFVFIRPRSFNYQQNNILQVVFKTFTEKFTFPPCDDTKNVLKGKIKFTQLASFLSLLEW